LAELEALLAAWWVCGVVLLMQGALLWSDWVRTLECGAGADDNLAWAAQAVTGGAIWTFGLFFFGADLRADMHATLSQHGLI
jgi:hypothetical protein